MNLSPRSIVFGASVTAVVAAVTAGLIILGSPAQERERRIDDRRVADLHGIAAATNLYWSRHSRLPASLDDLTAEPGLRIYTRDPATSESYGYQALDSARYEVCATFDRESGTASGEPTIVPPIVQASCQGCHGPGPVARTPVGDPVAAQLKLQNLWAHRAGRQCFQMHAQGAGEAHGLRTRRRDGETGAGRWGELAPSFAVCAEGAQQSPMDLAGAIPAGAGTLDIQWHPAQAHLVDIGHTIQVDVAEGSSINLEGRHFSLLQFHFHLPSEHAVDGDGFPMEVHFVHQAEEGDLAVVGVFMGIGESHPAIERIWGVIPGSGEPSATLPELDPRTLLPEEPGYFRYAGSLTTPPCSEVVSWVVMTEPISVSPAQADAFPARYPMNARPVQALNRRSMR